MIRTSEFILNFVLNATWQITLVAFATLILARALRQVPVRYLHALWAASLGLCLALPLWSLIDYRDSTIKSAGQPTARIFRIPAVIGLAIEQPAQGAGTNHPVPALAADRSNWRATLSDPRLFLGLAALYLCFVLYRTARLAFCWRRLKALRKSIYRIQPTEVMTVVAAHCQAALKLKTVPVVMSAHTQTPITLGAVKPVVILPESCYGKLEFGSQDDTLYSVLGHEMAHIARHDFAWNIFYELLLLLIGFHPLTKYMKRQIDRTRELACDELVTEKLLERKVHARSLVRVASALVVPSGQPLTLGIFDADILEERIMRLTINSRRLGRATGKLLAVATLSVLCLSGLAIGTFSFELRAAHLPAAGTPARETTARLGAATITQEPAADKATREESQRALASSNARERAQAACEAGRRGLTDAIPQLVNMLGDDSPTEPLRCWTEGKWNPALDTFKHPSPGEQAAIALASMGLPAVEVLTNALGSNNATVRRNAAWAIGELTNMKGGERGHAVPPLIALLGDSDGWVRMAAARALGELHDDRAGDRLTDLLLDNEPGVRQTSAWALGEMKEKQAVQTLCLILVTDSRSEVRLAAAEALGEIRSQKAISSLNQALNDSEPRVRAKVKWAIAEIEDSDG